MTARLRAMALLAPVLDALPPGLQVLLSGRRQIVVDGQRLDPGLQLLLTLQRMVHGGWPAPGPVEEERAATREEAALTRRRLAPVAAVRDLEVAGAAGSLAARHYIPAGAAAPLFVYFHGGGWVTGDLDTHDMPCRALCHHAGVHVLAVDYRLAPEHRFPAPVDDALAAWRWAVDHAGALGADPTRIAVGGDSAGGNLAAVVARAASRGEAPAPALQLLIYPVADLSRKRRSYELFGEDFFLTSVQMDWYAEHLLGPGGDSSDPRCSPLLAEELSGLAPAIVVSAGFDPLRDETEEYAAAMRAADVPVVLRRFDSLIHGFVNAGGVNRASQAALVEVAGMLRAGLALSSTT